MSRTPRINPALAALDAEIRQAEQTHREHEKRAVEALAVLKALTAARDRIGMASPTRAPRSAKPWKPRGPVEKAIVRFLDPTAAAGPASADQLRTATGAAPASLRAALARMVEAKAVELDVDDRYSLAGAGIAEAAQ